MKALLLIVLATLQLGCAVEYTWNADKTRSFKAGFNPDIYDYKAIKEIRR